MMKKKIQFYDRWWRQNCKYTKVLSLWSTTSIPTIASGATPIGSADRATDEKLLWEDKQLKVNEENDWVHYRW
jgi:hypothetical protein